MLLAFCARASDAPLTVWQKYKYSMTDMVSGPHIVAILMRASMDHATETPGGWGTGVDSFGVRMAHHAGRSLLWENMRFGMTAIDHEDPRYFASREKGVWKRTRSAVWQTFAVRSDSGGTMPAYSRFAADYGTPFLSQQWRPGGMRMGRELRSGSMALGVGAGFNVWQEFWPDMKKRVLSRK